MAASINVLEPGGSPALPSHSGHYQFRARLGEGGYGEVYEAWDNKLCRAVAIKRIKHSAAAAQGADLLHEARMAASLRHAAFVKVHAIDDEGDSQSIVMELVPGQTFKQALAANKPQLGVALEWIRQVAEAMQDAHAGGMVHGDLKPSNLMIEPGGRVRILDFGLALRQDSLATTTLTGAEPQGTIAYMAPERLLGAPPDVRGDVYALGVILYELACGTRPFATLNGLALAAAHVQSSSDSWDYPESLDTPLIALIRAMTARQPEHRVPDMGEVLRRMNELAGVDANSSMIPALAAQAPAPVRAGLSLPSLRTAVIGAVVLATLLAGAAWWQFGPALPSLQQALTPYSEAAEMNGGLAALKLYDRPGELERAEDHFNRILQRTPDNAAAVAGMSLVQNLRYAGDRQDEVWLHKADAGSQLAFKLNDQLALSHIARGAVLDSQNRFDEAVIAYEQALRLDPANYFAWYGKVESLRHGRHWKQALTTLAEAMRRFPAERAFLDELGCTHFDQGDYAAAEQAFRRSIALQPDAVMAYANLNAALLHQNRNEDALRVLQQGLQVRPSARLYSHLGNALFVRGDYIGAAEAFENAVSPTRGAPGKYLNWANLADTLLWLPGREQQARSAYDKARQLLAPQLVRAPNDVVLVSRMGLYSARAGDAKQATTLMRQAIALAPEDAKVQFRAGLAYELLGKRAMALEAIGKARRLGYPVKLIESEPDLVGLRRDPGYQQE